MTTTLDAIAESVFQSHRYEDGDCICGQLDGGFGAHINRELVRAGRVSVIVAQLNLANSLLESADALVEETVTDLPPEPRGIGAVVAIELDNFEETYITNVVHAGNGMWFDNNKVEYTWADIIQYDFEILAEGQVFEDVSPST